MKTFLAAAGLTLALTASVTAHDVTATHSSDTALKSDLVKMIDGLTPATTKMECSACHMGPAS